MPLVSFARYLDGEGLSFGLADDLLERIGRRSRKGDACAVLLSDPEIQKTGLGPIHLLRIRRALRRYEQLVPLAKDVPGTHRDRLGPAAVQWAQRHAGGDERKAQLTAAFAAAVAATLKRGRLRVFLKRPEDPRSDELASLAGHTEGCDELPPHRWFATSRAVMDGLVWVEVLPPEGEVEAALGREVALVEDLKRSLAKPVLDTIGARAERQVIATAADSLYALLSRPRIEVAVAGVYLDGKRIRVFLLGGEHDGDEGEFGAKDTKGLAAWLGKRDIHHVGISHPGSGGTASSLIQALATAEFTVELVRHAALMKQAGTRKGPIKRSAAAAVARRLQDPLEGYEGLEPDELGIGEYLDRVDEQRLRAALKDARDVVRWERAQGRTSAPVARGLVAAGPVVKRLEDLRPGMELTGTVANLTHFGAFIELGFSVQGMVHLSELADRFVKHPSEVVKVGDRVRVRVLEVDMDKKRISLTMRSDGDTTRRRPRDKRAQAVKALEDLFKK
jgi:predicted RNA-binding protein with RPS1 domain